MIEILDGIHETINYGNSLGLRLYHNVEYEDYPEHWHAGIEMIMPIREGYRVLAGNDVYDLGEGDILILNTSVLHSLEAPPTGERVILQFNISLLHSLKEMETLLTLLPPVTCLKKDHEDRELYSYVKKRMDRIIEEYKEKQPFCEAVIYADLISIFAALGRRATEGMYNRTGEQEGSATVKQKKYMETVLDACSYINHHYQENIILEQVASISGFSKFHFTRIFKQCMDMTFYEYLNEKRITKAEELLYTTVLSITDIAMNSGFSSISAFNRTFKSIKGCSPSEYRNKLYVCPKNTGGGVKTKRKIRIRVWSGNRLLWFFFYVRNVEYRNKCKEEGKI